MPISCHFHFDTKFVVVVIIIDFSDKIEEFANINFNFGINFSVKNISDSFTNESTENGIKIISFNCWHLRENSKYLPKTLETGYYSFSSMRMKYLF